MSVEPLSSSAGRNITFDWTVNGTRRCPDGRSNDTSFTSLATIGTASDFPSTEIVTSPLIGPVDNVNVILDAPFGTTQRVVAAVPRDQNTSPSGYACSSV